MQEFIYYNASGLDFPISEKIFVTTNIDEVKNKNFLISNSNDINCELVASEIDFYIKNSQDNLSDKIKNVSELYEIAATKYDFALDVSDNLEISNELLLITNTKEQYKDFILGVEPNDFEVFNIQENILKSISGTIGNFQVIVDSDGKDVPLNVSQIVYFDYKDKQRAGIYNPNLSSIDEVLETLKNNINSYSYKKFTSYDA
ncbi:MAG: 4Fe-4S ferredoxin, partial [Arcobacter sp.]